MHKRSKVELLLNRLWQLYGWPNLWQLVVVIILGIRSLSGSSEKPVAEAKPIAYLNVNCRRRTRSMTNKKITTETMRATT